MIDLNLGTVAEIYYEVAFDGGASFGRALAAPTTNGIVQLSELATELAAEYLGTNPTGSTRVEIDVTFYRDEDSKEPLHTYRITAEAEYSYLTNNA